MSNETIITVVRFSWNDTTYLVCLVQELDNTFYLAMLEVDLSII